MAITPGSTILTSDFISDSTRSATPSSDANRAPKLENDGRIHPFFTGEGGRFNSGEALAGATTPVPIYMDGSGDIKACDANDTARLDFRGFVTTTAAGAGQGVRTQFNGTVPGFSGLTIGATYYVQDAIGTIGTTPGTYKIPVGIAVSATTLLIQKRRLSRIGTGTASATGTVTVPHNLGFAPQEIEFSMSLGSLTVGNIQSFCFGSYLVAEGTYAGLSVVGDDTPAAAGIPENPMTTGFYAFTGASSSGFPVGVIANISNVTASSFDIIFTKPSATMPPCWYTWKAIGTQR